MKAMFYALFSLIVLLAGVIGALAGIGGGVIIRPALDAFGYFENPSITNTISSFCVLFVALTSIAKRFFSKTKIPNYKTAVFLGIGAAIGGVVGQILFGLMKAHSDKSLLIIVQSAILIAFLIFVFIYMTFLNPKGVYLHVKSPLMMIFIGFVLGVVSAFLGIGGGPINVAVLAFFFAMPIKESSVNSLIIIIFAQVAKILYSLCDGNMLELFAFSSLAAQDQTWWIYLLVLIPMAIIGSLIGTYLNKKLPGKVISILYIATLFVIMGINAYNIVAQVLILS